MHNLFQPSNHTYQLRKTGFVLPRFNITVEPLITDTSIIRTPLFYGQFTWSLRDRNPYKAYLSKTDTSIIRTLIPVPLVSVIKRFDCISYGKHSLRYLGPKLWHNLSSKERLASNLKIPLNRKYESVIYQAS